MRSARRARSPERSDVRSARHLSRQAASGRPASQGVLQGSQGIQVRKARQVQGCEALSRSSNRKSESDAAPICIVCGEAGSQSTCLQTGHCCLHTTTTMGQGKARQTSPSSCQTHSRVDIGRSRHPRLPGPRHCAHRGPCGISAHRGRATPQSLQQQPLGRATQGGRRRVVEASRMGESHVTSKRTAKSVNGWDGSFRRACCHQATCCAFGLQVSFLESSPSCCRTAAATLRLHPLLARLSFAFVCSCALC